LLALASRLDEARAISEEALNLAIRDLGRENKYTRYAVSVSVEVANSLNRSCFSNLNIILTKIGDTKGIELLKEKWNTCDQISDNDVKGISSEEFKDIVEELTYSVKVCFFLSIFFSLLLLCYVIIMSLFSLSYLVRCWFLV
jgi:hypothetical protein